MSAAPNMIILPDTGGIVSTNCFVIADDSTKHAVLFDAPDHTAGSLLDEVERRGWSLIGLWLTHGHFDHVADHAVVTARFPQAKVLIHRLDLPKLQHPMSTPLPLPFTIPPGEADALVEEGQVLELGSLRATVLHTPGHSPGHVMYHFAEQKVLVGGDLIIMDSIGRTDLPDSVEANAFASIRRVMALPDDTKLLVGHGPTRAIREVRRDNKIVRWILEQG